MTASTSFFGYVGKEWAPVDLDNLRELFRFHWSPGKRFAVAWLDPWGRLFQHEFWPEVLRSASPKLIVSLVGTAQAVLCAVTRPRSPDLNLYHSRAFSFQPLFPTGGGWYAQSGEVTDGLKLLSKVNAPMDYGTLGLLAEREQKCDLVTAWKRAVALAKPTDRLAAAGIWTSPRRVLLLSRGKTIHTAYTAGGEVYFSTQEPGLQLSGIKMTGQLTDGKARLLQLPTENRRHTLIRLKETDLRMPADADYDRTEPEEVRL